jgi:hypothetical protein
MTQEEEKYIHFTYCIENLNNAWRILQEIKLHKGNPLSGPAFQFALIEYSKPYKKSYGVIQNSHKLHDEYIPSQYLALHKRILAMRDQFHAHTDLNIRDAKVYINNTVNGKIVSIGQNVIYGTEEFTNIDAIIDLTEQTLDSMYNEVKRLEAILPSN